MTALRVLSFYLITSGVIASERGLPHFEKVDDHVYRGCQPENEGFASLRELGIKTVIDMRGGWIHMPREKRLVQQAGLNYVEERFSGIFQPHDSQVAKLLAVMQDPNSTPVFVHCRRGADRVGLLIACYRMAHDHWTNEQALDEARKYGLSPFEILMRSYIRHFDPARLSNQTSTATEFAAPIQILRVDPLAQCVWGGQSCQASCPQPAFSRPIAR